MGQRKDSAGSTMHRVARACDMCSASKQRCNGKLPCSRCSGRGNQCKYAKPVLKRGPRSRKHMPDSQQPVGLSKSSISAEQRTACLQSGPSCDTPQINQANKSRRSPLGPHSRVLSEHRVGNDSSAERGAREECSNGNPSDQVRSPDRLIGDFRIASSPVSFQKWLSGILPGSDDRLGATHEPQAVSYCPSSILGSYDMEFGREDGYPSSQYSEPWSNATTNMLPSQRDGFVSKSALHGLSYRCLDPLLSRLKGILSLEEAGKLLEIYLIKRQPGSMVSPSPYVFAHVIRPSSILHPLDPRPTSPVLVAALLYCSAQTSDIYLFDVPGTRVHVTTELYLLVMDLLQVEEAENYLGRSDFLRSGGNIPAHCTSGTFIMGHFRESVDSILAVVLLAIVTSSGNSKADAQKWWSKALHLLEASGITNQDEPFQQLPSIAFTQSLQSQNRASVIANEERRRLFWLVYALDRHFALCFNQPVRIIDGGFTVFTPLPEKLWEQLDIMDIDHLTPRSLGPPLQISGCGFFEFFLPLAVLLGHIVSLHEYRQHPVLGHCLHPDASGQIEALLSKYHQDLTQLSNLPDGVLEVPPGCQDSELPLVVLYSTYILHVFHILLHGKWDPMTVMESEDEWTTSIDFFTCTSHAISAARTISQILHFDPELSFMPYLFGIYLLHGSFMVLLFADRTSDLGPNEGIAEACETIVHAHEVSVVTLETTFQKHFRKVLRSMLYDIRHPIGLQVQSGHKRRRQDLLSLYRWTPTGRGLAHFSGL